MRTERSLIYVRRFTVPSGAEDVIHAATSAGDVEASKPAPDLVQVALRHACAEPAETVFVGDAVWMPAPASVRRSGASAC